MKNDDLYANRPTEAWTDQMIIDDALHFPNRGVWSAKRRRLYMAAWYRGLLPKIYETLPETPLQLSDDEIVAHAHQFRTRKEWKAASKKMDPSPYRCAVYRKIYQKCVAHMEPTKPDFSNYTKPVKYTNEEIKASATLYQHKNDWKHGHNHHYQSAIKRGKKFFNECTAHMTPAANPYAGDYVIYAFKFSDHRIYVGLTFKVDDRRKDHLRFGPVCRHIQECPTYEFTILQDKITSPAEAVAAEKKWIDYYRNEPGWTIMNDAPGGSLGAVKALSREWTIDELADVAGQFRTRKEWLLGNQAVYKRAKRMGVFEEVCRKAGLPQRVSPRPVTIANPAFIERYATTVIDQSLYNRLEITPAPPVPRAITDVQQIIDRCEQVLSMPANLEVLTPCCAPLSGT